MRPVNYCLTHLLWAALVVGWTSAGADALTEQEAVDILVNEVIDPPTLDHDLVAFTLHRPLEPQEQVRPFMDGAPTTITEPTWFFWIDDRPKYKFTHATRFVFIDDATSTVIVEDHKWFPVLNGTALWRVGADYWNDANWAFSRLKRVYDPNTAKLGACPSYRPGRSARVAGAAGDAKNGTNGAVVVNGTDEGFMQQDKEHMEDSFADDGYEVYNVGPDTGNGAEDFEEAVEGVINSGCTNVTIYVSSHGGHDGGEDYFVLGDEKYTESDMRALLNFYSSFAPGVTFKFIFDFCHCGSFKETFEACANAVFWHFACGADEESASAKPDYHNPDCTNADPNGGAEFPGSESTTGFHEDLEKIKNSTALKVKLALLALQYGIHSNVVKYLFAEITSMRNDECARAGETTPFSDARIASTHVLGASPARVDDDTQETYAIWRYRAYVAPDGPPAGSVTLNTLPGQYLWAQGGVLQSPATMNQIRIYGTAGDFPPLWEGHYEPLSGMITIQALPGAPPLLPGEAYHFMFHTMAMDLGFVDYAMSDMFGIVIPDGQGETFGPAEFSICNDPFADLDADGDVDHDDWGVMQACITGDDPGDVPYGCDCANGVLSSPDPERIDADDVAAFEACASGPDVPADPLCDGP